MGKQRTADFDPCVAAAILTSHRVHLFDLSPKHTTSHFRIPAA
jgi:hypothetical protein